MEDRRSDPSSSKPSGPPSDCRKEQTNKPRSSFFSRLASRISPLFRYLIPPIFRSSSAQPSRQASSAHPPQQAHPNPTPHHRVAGLADDSAIHTHSPREMRPTTSTSTVRTVGAGPAIYSERASCERASSERERAASVARQERRRQREADEREVVTRENEEKREELVKEGISVRDFGAR